MASLYSHIAANAALLPRHEPAYATQLATVGAAAGTDRAGTATSIVNSNAHSPTVVAFQLNAEPTKVYIGHTPIRSPTDLNAADLVMVMVGDDLEEASPVVLPAEAFARTNEHAFYNKTYIKGPNGSATAGGAVVQFDRQATGRAVAMIIDFIIVS